MEKPKFRIGFDINGVLRNTIGKIEQTYEKYYLLKTDGIDDEEESFQYEMNLPVTSLELKEHFKFKDDEELYSFLYDEFAMEIFGHAQSSEYSTFNDLQQLYLNYRDDNDLTIVSDEISKSKPATLFFLSKFICQLEKIKFFSNLTINSMWDEIDILLTSNPSLLLNKPSDKIVVKYETEYNKDIESEHTITTLKEFDDKLKQLLKC
jgi:hypothetical protein